MPEIDVASPAKGDATATLKSPVKSPARKNCGPPLDYSWMELKTTADVLYKEPVSGAPKCQALPPGTDAEAHLDTVIGEGTKTRANSCNADSIRLCNNQLTSLSGLDRVAHHLLDDPADLAWLDVSFNQLTRIDDIVASFPNLKVLYLHGNRITSLNEVLKLQALPHLTKLTLHGNPVSEKKDYKAWVLSHLPTVRDFDFSPVTKLDREKITQWFAAYSKKHAQ